MKNSKYINQVLFLGFVLVFVFAGLAAQAKLPSPKAGDPMALFDHNKHHEYFSKLSTSCEVCHKTQDSYTRDKVEKLGCHACHNNAQSPSAKAKKFKCITCHKDLKKVKPENHYLNWMSVHQTTAKQGKKDCLKCHKSFDCTSCHQQRDTINQKIHSRNYRYYHSIEARSNPQKCDRCHKVSYCKECHAAN